MRCLALVVFLLDSTFLDKDRNPLESFLGVLINLLHFLFAVQGFLLDDSHLFVLFVAKLYLQILLIEVVIQCQEWKTGWIVQINWISIVDVPMDLGVLHPAYIAKRGNSRHSRHLLFQISAHLIKLTHLADSDHPLQIR